MKITAITILSFLLFISFKNLPQNFTIKTSKADLLEMKTIYGLIKTNPNCTISHFEIMLIKNKNQGGLTSFKSKTANFDVKILKLLKNAAIGDKIYIDNLESDGDCHLYQNAGVSNYQIIVEN